MGRGTNPVEVTALGSTYRLLEGGAGVDGRYSLCEETFWGDPPPLHVHEAEEESFYVLSGRGSVVVGDAEHHVGPGSFVHVPRGVPHTLRRSTEEPLRMLTVVSPAGFEQFFFAVAATPGGEDALDEQALADLAAQYGCRLIDEEERSDR